MLVFCELTVGVCRALSTLVNSNSSVCVGVETPSRSSVWLRRRSPALRSLHLGSRFATRGRPGLRLLGSALRSVVLNLVAHFQRAETLTFCPSIW